MESMNYIFALIPMGAGLIIFMFIVIMIVQVYKARIAGISKNSFEKLSRELKEENAKIMTELSSMKENLSSINKMMKEIE